MVYKNQFVVCVKVGGKILRESGGKVAVPFGSEYTVLLKNLSSVRSRAAIEIDGEPAVDWVIVPANESVEIERFFRGTGNREQGNKFKFIKRTQAIEAYRGVKACDSLLRVEYRFEQACEPPVLHHEHVYHHYDFGWWPWYRPYTPWPWPWTITCHTVSSDTQGEIYSTNTASTASAAQSINSVHEAAASTNDPGITVPGGESHQQFCEGAGFPTEAQSHVIVLALVGSVAGVAVTKPVTVKTKPTCTTCGKKNKSTHKCCQECGTSLQVF
jgi:hypothetical protein